MSVIGIWLSFVILDIISLSSWIEPRMLAYSQPLPGKITFENRNPFPETRPEQPIPIYVIMKPNNKTHTIDYFDFNI